MWIVTLTKPLPPANSFRADFFPRKVRYKADAEKLKAEVASEGGEAKVVRADKVVPA